MYKVVIVDDEPIIVEGLTKLLPREKYGCNVAVTAYNGNEGLEAIRREKPGILFADIAMPGLDLRIADIAEMVGFPDVAHFSRVFKKITGVSANEYRNKKIG